MLANPFIKDIVASVNRIFIGLLALAAILPSSQASAQEGLRSALPPAQVVVIPVRSEIGKPALYILRRGLKDAIEQKVDTVVLDMETPGGALDVTFDILKALEKFPGKTITYVNREAVSAGALISAGTDEIWFAPEGVIGAAAPVLATGAEIDATMRSKIVSYLKARVRSVSEGKGFRGEVISAMIDVESEFKIGDTVIKEKGELLSLTAQEAIKHYGDPAHTLLGEGIATDINDLLDQIHGHGNYSLQRLELSWSEQLAQYLTAITPLLLAAGLLGLFIEFKTPGFGIFGILGIVLLGVVFFGHYVAGLSGHEVVLLFLLGIALIAVEVFLLPGTVLPALVGAIMVLVSLVWMMLDVWPGEPFAISGDVLLNPLLNVCAGVVGAVLLFIAILRFLPGTGPWGRMILHSAVASAPAGIHPLHTRASDALSPADLTGKTGVAATGLFPSGQIVIDGKRYEARVALGFADAGTAIRVTRSSEFGLIVEVIS